MNADVSGITSIVNNGLTEFLAGTTAGSIAITNNRTLDFSGNASAGNATITTGADSLTRFFDTSTAVYKKLLELGQKGGVGGARAETSEACVSQWRVD